MQIRKNIVFDLGGVLVGLNGERSIKAFDALNCGVISQYIRDHRTEDLFYDIELGLLSTEGFCDEVRRMSGTMACNADIVMAWNVLLETITPKRRQCLQQLHDDGHRLFLLSNTNDMHWKYCLRQGLPVHLFEQVFLSYEMQLSKPDPRIFQEVLKRANLLPEETLFIDDNSDNIATAAALGIHTYYNNKEIDGWTERLRVGDLWSGIVLLP